MRMQCGVSGAVRSHRGLRFAPVLVVLLAGLAPAVLRAASLTASLDRSSISLGESATLSITFEGGSPENVPTPPAIPNLEISYVGPSSQFSFINGQVSSTVTHAFTLTPRQAGDYPIPSMTIEVGGQKLSTRPLRLSVAGPGAPPPGAAADSGPVFFKLHLPRKELYVGETAVAELQLYLSDKIQNLGRFQLNALPAEGFTVGKMVEGQHRRVQAGDSVYTEIPISVALTPVKAGALTVGPVTAGLVVEFASPNRRRDPVWDPFGMMERNEQKAVSVVTDAETVQALPLPDRSAAPNFNGAVGNYTMTVTAGPTNLSVGDPITVRIQVTGSGTLDSLVLPDQPGWRDFKVYPGAASKIDSSDPFGIQGTKTFEEVVVPQNGEIHSLPPVTFSYFDTDKRSYQTLTGPEIVLAVHAGGAAAVPVVAAANHPAQDTPPPDIVSIKQHFGEVTELGPPLVQRPWFLALQGVPAIARISAVFRRKRRESLANNPRLRRRRHVAQQIRDGRVDLQTFAAGNKSDEFFATLSRLLQEQLGERLDLPASAITEAVIEERLLPRGVPEQTLAPLRDLFHTCNVARFAPIKSSGELAAFIPKVETVLRELREVQL
jgi:hypothetical protein